MCSIHSSCKRVLEFMCCARHTCRIRLFAQHMGEATIKGQKQRQINYGAFMQNIHDFLLCFMLESARIPCCLVRARKLHAGSVVCRRHQGSVHVQQATGLSSLSDRAQFARTRAEPGNVAVTPCHASRKHVEHVHTVVIEHSKAENVVIFKLVQAVYIRHNRCGGL